MLHVSFFYISHSTHPPHTQSTLQEQQVLLWGTLSSVVFLYVLARVVVGWILPLPLSSSLPFLTLSVGDAGLFFLMYVAVVLPFVVVGGWVVDA